MDCWQSEGFKEAFHLNPLLPDVREEGEKVFGPLGIGVEADVEGLIPIRDCFSYGLEDFLHPSEGYLFSTSNRLLRWDITTAPGALDRAAPAQGEVIDGRSQRINPEILLFGDTLHIEGLTDITDIGGVIF